MSVINNYFVVTAVVAAELHRTLQDCRVINLTASNAQAASLRAGQQAVGFRALTKFIDELAGYTTRAAKQINVLAIKTSKIAANTARADAALKRFYLVKRRASGATFADSLSSAVDQTEQRHQLLKADFEHRVAEMRRALDDLNQQLRTATVLASIARVEASRVDSKNQETFTAVADTVDAAAAQIKKRVNYSIGLFAAM